jgi:hypothetical protein
MHFSGKLANLRKQIFIYKSSVALVLFVVFEQRESFLITDFLNRWESILQLTRIIQMIKFE